MKDVIHVDDRVLWAGFRQKSNVIRTWNKEILKLIKSVQSNSYLAAHQNSFWNTRTVFDADKTEKETRPEFLNVNGHFV